MELALFLYFGLRFKVVKIYEVIEIPLTLQIDIKLPIPESFHAFCILYLIDFSKYLFGV